MPTVLEMELPLCTRQYKLPQTVSLVSVCLVHLSDENELLHKVIILALLFHYRADCSNFTNDTFEEGLADCMTSLLVQIIFCMRYDMSLPDR
jgi:hypothetical protein